MYTSGPLSLEVENWFPHHSAIQSKATLSHESAVVLQKGTERKTSKHLRQMHINLTDAKIVTFTVGQIICLNLLRFDTIPIYYIQTNPYLPSYDHIKRYCNVY